MRGAVRQDGRQDAAIREIHIVQNVLNNADGSCRFSMGKTVVIASVFGPYQAPTRLEAVDRAVIEVSISHASATASPIENRMQSTLRRTLEAVVLLTQYPRCIIRVAVLIVEQDGSVLSACMNAACMALLDGSVPLRGILTSVSVGVSEGRMLVDCVESEECECESVFELGCVGDKVVWIDCSGSSWSECLELGRKGCMILEGMMRMSVEKHIKGLYQYK